MRVAGSNPATPTHLNLEVMYYYELTITNKLLNKSASYKSEVKRPFFTGIVSNHILKCFYLLNSHGSDEFKIETNTFLYDVHRITE